jgi:hypothetical protein
MDLLPILWLLKMTNLASHIINVHIILGYVVCFSVLDITNVNIQASEQLNAWVGGFESILSKMNVPNFNWFLHTMLFMHTE